MRPAARAAQETWSWSGSALVLLTILLTAAAAYESHESGEPTPPAAGISGFAARVAGGAPSAAKVFIKNRMAKWVEARWNMTATSSATQAFVHEAALVFVHQAVDGIFDSAPSVVNSITRAIQAVWNREQDEAALLAKIHEATSAEDIVTLVNEYSWSPQVLEASFHALQEALARGEVTACHVLQHLLVGQPQKSSQWAALRHLQQLKAETCLPSLRLDFKKLLTVDALPEGTESPPTDKPDPFAALIGQSCAISQLMKHLELQKKGRQRQDKAAIAAMIGPSGTGKTSAARIAAEVIHGRPIKELEDSGRFRVFPMNQFRLEHDVATFFGPARGIAGSGALPDLIREHPDAVIVLDEIEKAHSHFAPALLKVFDNDGKVYDPHTGKEYPVANATFFLTSNSEAEFISKHQVAVAKLKGLSVETRQKLPPGADGDPDCMGYRKLQRAVKKEMSHPSSSARESNFFLTPEMRGRIDYVVLFLPLGAREVEDAVRGFLAAESKTFSQSPAFANVELAWNLEVVQHFARLYRENPDEGLRTVQKELQFQVRDLLSQSIDEDLVAPGTVALLRFDKGEQPGIDIRAVAPQHEEPEEEAAENGVKWPIALLFAASVLIFVSAAAAGAPLIGALGYGVLAAFSGGIFVEVFKKVQDVFGLTRRDAIRTDGGEVRQQAADGDDVLADSFSRSNRFPLCPRLVMLRKMGATQSEASPR